MGIEIASRFFVGLDGSVVGSRGASESVAGRGVFVTDRVRAGSPILSFGGVLLSRDEYCSFADLDHCIQVGPDQFLGPSGELDDYTNHSCDPSTRVIVERADATAVLIAVRDLISADEVTFDYSTVQLNDSRFWIDPCRCGAAGCRTVIGDFTSLSWSEKWDLQRRGLLAWYTEEAFHRERQARYGR
ncbi:MAG: SET domain-containing protein [Acidobacteriota bacterium]|nr:SET domain-containing protein [Acidobacteriota bacterium]